MPITIPPPSVENVQKLYAHLSTIWSSRFVIDKKLQDMINQRNKIETLKVDEGKNMTPVEFHSGRAGGIIEHGRGLLMAPPSFKYLERDQTTLEARDGDRIERVAAKLFEQSLIKTRFWPKVAKDVLMSRAFLKCHTLPSAWTFQSGYPLRKEGETAKAYLKRVEKFKHEDGKFPFVITHVPLLNIYPLVDAEDNVVAHLELKRVMAGLLAEFGSEMAKDAIREGQVQWYEDMTVLEYGDPTYVAYFVSLPLAPYAEESIDVASTGFEDFRTWEHGLGVDPVVMIPGIDTGETRLEDRYKSFLDDAMDALVKYDFLLSRLATMVWAYYLPSYLWQLAESGQQFQGKDRPVLNVNLGGVTPIFSDEALAPLPYPTQLPDASLLLQTTDDIIQRHTLEDVLFGRVQGSAPAFQVNLRINVARSKLSPIAENMAIGITKVAERFFRGVMNLKETVVIDGEECTPALAKKALGRLAVEIDPKSPVDRNQDIGTANMALQFGLDWDWICENILDIKDPATMRLKKDVRALEETPQAQERLLKDAFEMLDVMIEENEMTDIAGMDPNELPPGMVEALREAGGVESGGGVGRGPYPQGAAPQTIQGGRGLNTQKEQPMPGTPMSGTGMSG